jgi:phosphoglycerol transferase MdoB-like AlkP superfamily enzyme
LLILALAVLAIVAIPVWMIQPFAPQTPRNLETSYLLKSWSPLLTLAALLITVLLSVFIWRDSKRWFGKALLILPLAIVLVCTWFARQNHFEWMFNPLEQTAFAGASEADFVADDDMVMAVKINGESVAYPIRQMAYHHVVQDVVGGKPITATY